MKNSVTIDINIEGINELKKYIEKTKKYSSMKTDKDFQKFIQGKVRDTLVETMNERLTTESTNSDYIELYRNSNHIVEAEDGNGFILYNDAKIPVYAKGVQNVPENYPEGMFSIALAFEYGVGIVGMNTDFDPTKYAPWQYNVQDYNFGWYLPKHVKERYNIPDNFRYMGYAGFEIYRYTADKVEKRLSSWVNEYYSKGDK